MNKYFRESMMLLLGSLLEENSLDLLDSVILYIELSVLLLFIGD